MILFGHLGLTFGAVRTVDKYMLKENNQKIDYRFVFIGSILPDLIDKTIIFFTSNETFKSGRLIAHTFLFTLILFSLGLAFSKTKKGNWLFLLSFGVLIHQILDYMWLYLDILLWPFYGYSFSKGSLNFNNWFKYALHVFNKKNPVFSFSSIKDRLMSRPDMLVAELAGFIILAILVSMLIKYKQTNIFIEKGRIDFLKKPE